VVNATPNMPASGNTSAASGIKVASPDIVLIDNDLLPVDIMASLIFENIGGQEIINIARNDIVNGQSVVYAPIKNLASVNLRYNPLNIISLQNPSNDFFRSFAINLANHTPSVGTGPNGSWVFIEPTSGSLTVDLVEMDNEFEVEVQVISAGELLDGTIY
jgi:hypothetical protein